MISNATEMGSEMLYVDLIPRATKIGYEILPWLFDVSLVNIVICSV